jgi:hypothetical protein
MAEDPQGWDVDLDQAITVVVTFCSDRSAEMTFETVDGPLGTARWEFSDFPVDDFFGRGLNILGPWLNRHGIAYQSWLEPERGVMTATAYRWDGPEVDERVRARREGR